MGKKLFVGNLSFSTTSEDLKNFFSEKGACEEATVIVDRATGRSRGFGFVQMANGEDADRAVAELNGAELQGRKLTVSEAREQSRPAGGGGGGRGPGGPRPGGGRPRY